MKYFIVMRIVILAVFYLSCFLSHPDSKSRKFVYQSKPLILTENTLADGLGTFTIEDLPVVTPKCSIGLKKNVTPLTKKMWKIALKGTSTNCIYSKVMLCLANAAKKCNLPDESKYWNKRAKDLKAAVRKELTLPDDTLTYLLQRPLWKSDKNQHNLGTAFTILFGLLEGKEARKAIDNYPTTDYGIPLIYPFLEDIDGDHNQASWSFCDTFFYQAKEMGDGKDYTGYNAALLA